MLNDDQIKLTDNTVKAVKLANKNKLAVGSLSCALLKHVDYYECKNSLKKVDQLAKNSRSVGLSYALILDVVKFEFPDAKTTLACLRWYLTKMKDSRHKLYVKHLPARR